MAENRVKDGNYYVVQSFMVKDLKLKGLEKDVYAIIYGFSQAENQTFTGSLKYLSDWTNSTKQGILKTLNSLVEKKLISKKENTINGVKFVEYYSTEFNSGGKLSLIPTIKQSLTNNIDTNNIINKESKKEKDETFDEIINSLVDNAELQEVLVDFIKMRKAIKKPLTNRALKSIINRTKQLSNNNDETAIKILDQSIRNGWQDVYDLSNNKNNYKNNNVGFMTRNYTKEEMESLYDNLDDAEI